MHRGKHPRKRVSGKMKRVCISSDDDDGSRCSGSMPSWAGKNTKLDTLLERLIDSVLLMNNKVEGLSNRVNALEQKVNEEIMLGRKERTEFMNEVKSETAELKKSQEQEKTVYVGSHLVSKLSNLQKLVRNGLPVDDASDSEGWRPWTSHSVVQQPSGQDKLSGVQQPSLVDGLWHNGWHKDLISQQPNGVDSRLNLPQLKRQKLAENRLPVDIARGSNGWRPWASHLDVQQPSGWDKLSDVQQRNLVDGLRHNGWGECLSFQQPNGADSQWNLPQLKLEKPVENESLVDTAGGSNGWRPWD